nr:PREDICTED: LOW QUALITY PROTEIN: folate transporter 1 [Camelus bactrianus]
MALSGQEAEKQGPAEPRPGREPESWWCLVSYLCFYGFMAQMRPGESFITPYLLGPDKNFTQKQVTNEITPVLSYSYLAVLQGLSYVSVWLLLLFGSSVLHMQLMELFFSVTMAARIAYSSYVFSLVPPAHYQRVAGYSRAAVLLGVFTSSVLGQLLVTVGRVPFSTLNYVSLAFLTFSLVLALFLRCPKRSLFFKLIIAAVTVVQAGLVFLMYRTDSIWLCYMAFVLFRGSYQFLVPIATFQIASSLSQELRALVFGVNTFLATVLKTIITLIVSDKRGLGLPVHSQFLVYFMYFLVLFVAYFFAALLVGLQHLRRGIHQPLPPAQELRSPVQEKAVQDGALGSLQPGARPLALEDGVEEAGPASPEQSQQPEAKA